MNDASGVDGGAGGIIVSSSSSSDIDVNDPSRSRSPPPSSSGSCVFMFFLQSHRRFASKNRRCRKLQDKLTIISQVLLRSSLSQVLRSSTLRPGFSIIY
mmetsp:Transcript_47127/g.115061  ORF Transcript_47127/g.115061 Transcript_47127/m.115061 type:complete len:99 (-) Transcript_47127:2175-2471(-)